MSNSSENLYRLDGRVPLGKALPFGLQHVLAMFVSNITPIMILAAAVGLDSAVSAALIQNCMVIAGIGTLVQLFPVWRIGSRLPIVMGISFTFLSLAIGIAGTYGMGTLIGAVIVGGLVEGLIMGTRSGDIDPAIVSFIADKEGITADEVVNILPISTVRSSR